MNDIPSNAIGYVGVIIEDIDEFQGVFVLEGIDFIDRAANKLMLSVMVSGTHPIGALQAALVEGIVTKNELLTGSAALALVSMTKQKNFVLKAKRESGGTRTEAIPMKAQSVMGAQSEFDLVPEVIAIRQRIAEKLKSNTRH